VAAKRPDQKAIGGNVGDIPGTGLGLATVKNLVEVQGGQANLLSRLMRLAWSDLP
jgi:signal transduction histidine kinase